jgi:hypothetical protein
MLKNGIERGNEDKVLKARTRLERIVKQDNQLKIEEIRIFDKNKVLIGNDENKKMFERRFKKMSLFKKNFLKAEFKRKKELKIKKLNVQ